MEPGFRYRAEAGQHLGSQGKTKTGRSSGAVNNYSYLSGLRRGDNVEGSSSKLFGFL